MHRQQCSVLRIRRYRPRLEILEDRNLLSTFTVDHLADDMVGDGLNGSLRYCITQAIDGDDIQFGVNGTINLTRALPDLARSISIEGPGADRITVRRNTGGLYRIFTVNTGATVAISGLTIANGVVNNLGGGILNSGTLTVSNCTIFQNLAAFGVGGGISNSNYGTLTLSSSTLTGNGASFGGGVYNEGTFSLSNSTVSENGVSDPEGYEGGLGGGIYNDGTFTVSNSTVSGNVARSGVMSDGRGGGILINLGTLTIGSSTISRNVAAVTGGMWNGFMRNSNVRNTIIAGNTGGNPDLSGNLGSLGHNLIGNMQGGSGFDPTDMLNVNPMLGPLQDNGGPTLTHALLPGSPALNAGDPGQLGVPDQRGVVRRGGVNIGAYQASASTFLLIAPDAIQAGVPFNLSVTVVDPFGQVAYGYTGTVTFGCDDAAAVLPDDYPFQLSDHGRVVFTVTLNTPGPVHLTVKDTADDSLVAALDLIVL